MNKAALKELDNFNGTETYHRLAPWSNFYLTDGTVHLALNADCKWLMDEIAAAQLRPEILLNPEMKRRQFWTLRDTGNGTAELICERDSGDVRWRKTIEYTDFPFDAVAEPRVWVAMTALSEDGPPIMVAYLPSEH